MARCEGIVLDPVYTGKAFAGLVDLVEKKAIGDDEPIIFLHTGGGPALFAFSEDLIPKPKKTADCADAYG
jgi:1-aminocyclopropane-1-carboxylate deaminase/D-cysteine desulfhydrase-like pyridoxal-dependent ACC family enzyme